MSDEILDDEEVGAERRIKLQAVLMAYKAFLESPGYAYYVSSRKLELTNLESAVVELDPIDRKDEIESFKLRGDIRTTREFIPLFEDTVSRLEDRIEAMLEAEQPTDTTETQE